MQYALVSIRVLDVDPTCLGERVLDHLRDTGAFFFLASRCVIIRCLDGAQQHAEAERSTGVVPSLLTKIYTNVTPKYQGLEWPALGVSFRHRHKNRTSHFLFA